MSKTQNWKTKDREIKRIDTERFRENNNITKINSYYDLIAFKIVATIPPGVSFLFPVRRFHSRILYTQSNVASIL